MTLGGSPVDHGPIGCPNGPVFVTRRQTPEGGHRRTTRRRVMTEGVPVHEGVVGLVVGEKSSLWDKEVGLSEVKSCRVTEDSLPGQGVPHY